MKWIREQENNRKDKSKSWITEKINKINKPLARQNKKEKRIQINEIISEKWDIITDTTKIQRIVTDTICQQAGSLKEEKFIETYSIPRWNQKEQNIGKDL